MKLIGIRIRKNETSPAVKKILNEEWYPFFETYKLDEKINQPDKELLSVFKEIDRKQSKLEKELYTSNPDGPAISVHAIVGKNGCGKSSLLEILFRLFNNLAYATIRDDDRRDSAHLYWARDLSATFFYTIKEKDNSELYCYLYCMKDGRIVVETEKDTLFDNWNEQKGEAKLINNRKALTSFFYSIIVNYSHYSLNIKEIHDLEGIESITRKDENYQDLFYKSGKESKIIKYEHWLNGLFHKNDGYLTPAVINPMRDEGNFDVNKETNLSRTRLISILVTLPQFLEGYEATKFELFFSFKTILRKLEAQSLNWESYKNENTPSESIFNLPYLKVLLTIYQKWYERVNITKTDKIEYEQEFQGNGQTVKVNTVDDIKTCIKELTTLKDGQMQASLLYLACKTISISLKYNGFTLEREEDINDLIDIIEQKHTHITAKIHQTLYHIENRLLSNDSSTYFSSLYDNGKIEIPICQLQNESGMTIDGTLEKLYPPIYETDLILNRTSGGEVTLSTMSSGERQMLYSMSSILYHLINLSSVIDDTHRVHYSNMNIILDEVEMYYHPEYQRKYLDKLLTSIDRLHLKKEIIRSINICIITHSPFLLSDILKRNILFLKEGKVANKDVAGETFGANVYDILKNGFFLEQNALGCFVDKKIKAVLDFINERENKNHEPMTESEAKEISEFIGDPFIKGYLKSRLP